VSEVYRHITGHFRDAPPGNHLHWYDGQQKLAAKSIKPTQKNPKYTVTAVCPTVQTFSCYYDDT